jgi:peptidoglycan/LPS O-acetylase OafA/YrhL
MAATRIGAIDGVRGLAALSVAIFHCLHLFPASGSKQALCDARLQMAGFASVDQT